MPKVNHDLLLLLSVTGGNTDILFQFQNVDSPRWVINNFGPFSWIFFFFYFQLDSKAYKWIHYYYWNL